jgi:hypothetical protein
MFAPTQSLPYGDRRFAQFTESQGEIMIDFFQRIGDNIICNFKRLNPLNIEARYPEYKEQIAQTLTP